MLLSIIIPVYNAEKYIERCIMSILNQLGELKELEIVVINDGSTDESHKILNKLAQKHEIISLFNQQNMGEGFSRNIGLEKARGEYIWFIDADDYIEGVILQNIYKTLIRQQPEIILIGYKSVDLIGNVTNTVKYKDEITSSNELLKNSIFSNNVWCKVIQLKLIKTNNLSFDVTVKTATDFDFSFRILYYSKKIITLKDVSYIYVTNPNSISNIRSAQHLNQLALHSVYVAKNIKHFLATNQLDYHNNNRIFQLWLNNFLFGLLFSLYRFDYDFQFIKKIVRKLKQDKNYPVSIDRMDIKKKVFTITANNLTSFLLLCRIKRAFTKSVS